MADSTPRYARITSAELAGLAGPKLCVRYDARNDCYEFDDNCDGFSRNPDLGDDNQAFYYWNDADDFDDVPAFAASLEHLAEKTWFTGEHARQLAAAILMRYARRRGKIEPPRRPTHHPRIKAAFDDAADREPQP